MDYSKKLKHHFTSENGWINDPNGLVYFNGYYHLFYQHAPGYEYPVDPMHWGHARTKDFINWENLPIALYPDMPYDDMGCWSGTAIVKDGVLYVIYTSIIQPEGAELNTQTVSVAYSTDGINFVKYEKNPVISHYPEDGSRNFRDPAVTCIDGKYYCIMASGHVETKKARLLLYESDNLFDWEYKGITAEWDNADFAECPSFSKYGDKYLLCASVCKNVKELSHYFSIMYGSFENGVFKAEITGEVDKGPDQYAGQMFSDDKGRHILISWIPGWSYAKYRDIDVGCMSTPREILIKNGKIYGFPVEEVQHLLKDSDPAVEMTDTGFVIKRTDREDVVYNGKIDDIKIIRDEYILEVFINGGEEVYSVLL